MKIIGCDFHPGYQQIAMLDEETGEVREKALSHEKIEEVRAFYSALQGPVRVGIEASGQSQWFERLLAELGHELWIGDAAKIRASCERKQKTDRRDALLLLAVADGRAVSADLGADASRARHAAVVVASCKVGEDAHPGEEPVAGAGVEPGRAAEVETVECSGKKATGRVSADAVGQPAESGVAGAARPTGSLDQRTGPGGSGTSQHTIGSAAIDDPSGSGADHGAGLRADRGARAALWPWKAGGQLLAEGADSGWDTSASRAILFCAGCWWKRRRARCGMNRKCAASINGWPSGSAEHWRRWPWRGSWQ